MSNMAYCRFTNTLADLRDCNEWLSENEPDKLGDEERKSFERLVKLCKRIADDYSNE